MSIERVKKASSASVKYPLRDDKSASRASKQALKQKRIPEVEQSVKNLKIDVQKPGQKEPEKTVTIPLTTLHIGLKLMPKKIKASLEAEGVDLAGCGELTKEKDLRGTLIEIERAGEKLAISIEGDNS